MSAVRLKEGYHTPVIMLTALGTTEDIVKGLDAGADDYLVKPFSFQELEARIKALLRRGKNVRTGNFGATTSCWIATPAVHGEGIR